MKPVFGSARGNHTEPEDPLGGRNQIATAVRTNAIAKHTAIGMLVTFCTPVSQRVK
jgi:hypothetical protein